MPEQPSPPVLRAIGVSKRYRWITALDDLSLEFRPGTTALLGRNGAGKSTLVRLLVGVESPTRGTVPLLVQAVEVSRLERMRSLGWLPQTFGYPSGMRVRDFLTYAAWLKGLGRAEVGRAVDAAMEFTDVHGVASRRMRGLSGGTLRRVGLAAAIVHDPPLLLLDEPTTGLDPVQRAAFHERLRALAGSKVVVMATHLLEDVAALAHRVAVIEQGRLIWTGDVEQLAAEAGHSGSREVELLRSGLVSLVGDQE